MDGCGGQIDPFGGCGWVWAVEPEPLCHRLIWMTECRGVCQWCMVGLACILLLAGVQQGVVPQWLGDDAVLWRLQSPGVQPATAGLL